MRKTDFMPVLLALLLVGLCMTSLTGCADRGKADPAPEPGQSNPAPAVGSGVEPSVPDAAAPESGPLSGEELKFFNESFFNGMDRNIRNQFLSSMYETAADIDLYELLYCGAGLDESMDDGEQADFEEVGGFVDCDITKVSAAGADAVLLEYTGLTLEETRKVGLGNFTYLPQYDAYYLGHGDTNYRVSVTVSAGEREGDLLHLYYNDDFYADGWKCVTLRETEGGGYQFVSNLYCNESDVPTA